MKHKDAEFSRDVMYYEAETCVQAGDLDGAIEICTNIQEEKADADALFLRGRAYFLQKNYEQAKVDFDAAVETKESYQLCLDIYELYQESSMKADGDRYLEAAVKIEPKTTEDYYNIGCAYYYLEEQDEAVKAFSKAMKDGSSAAMEMLGEVYLSNGQNDEAKALFSSYLSTDGFAAAANNGLALCALAENDTDSALSYIEEGLKTAEDSDRENLLFNQIEAARVAMTRYIKRGGKVWIKIFPDKPVTAQPAETRMGSGKGSLEYWVAVVKPGRVMFEIAGVPEETAREALRLAMHKLPCKCKVVSRADLEGGDNSEN